MLSLEQIKSYYPPKLHNFPLGLLREYLQYLILETVYRSRYANDLVFMGGTALRIVHDNQRFSEDLDFDNLSLSQDMFIDLSKLIETALTNEGFQVEIRNTFANAFHCYIRIPKILYDQGLSGLPDQKITIRIDTEPQNYKYEYETHLLDRFTVLVNIKTVPLPLLMAQKISAVLQRQRAKGRDFFDVAYLISRDVQPDMKYLAIKLNIPSIQSLKQKLIQKGSASNLTALANDVKPFLFDVHHIIRVESFNSIVERL